MPPQGVESAQETELSQEIELPATEIFHSSLGIRYPEHRDAKILSPDLWLDDKRKDDGAEGLWRIHNDLYDFTEWIDKHPGGSDWIRLTKGTDITEAFESHHISTAAELLLPQYRIRKIETSRNSPFTFHSDGFYNILKKRVREMLTIIPEQVTFKTKLMTDLLMIGFLVTALLSVIFYSFICGFISGLLLALVTIAAHNYFHQKDSFRMYYFDFSFMSHREWRISHAMSHHIYTNTVNDLEISMVQPFLIYLPTQDKIYQRLFSIIASPIFYLFLLIGSGIKRYILIVLGSVKEFNLSEFLPYTVPLLMYFVGGQTFLYTILMWFWIVSVASLYFGFIGVNAAHHHPEIFHDGDKPRENMDWGLYQIDAVMDRHDINSSLFLVLTSFGDHTLHHLFPTIDHSKLIYLYPVLQETCEEFGVKFRMTTQWRLIIGQYAQLLRTTPNPVAPGTKWKWYKTFVPELWNKIKIDFRNKINILKS